MEGHAQTNRNYAWENFMSGSQVLFMDPYLIYYPREARNLCASPTNGICSGPDKRWDNFRQNLGYILRYSRKLHLGEAKPQKNLLLRLLPGSNTVRGCGVPGLRARRRVLHGRSFGYAQFPELAVEWFDPSNGAATRTVHTSGSGRQSFTPPFAGEASSTWWTQPGVRRVAVNEGTIGLGTKPAEKRQFPAGCEPLKQCPVCEESDLAWRFAC